MRIVITNDFFSEKMGYCDYFLAKSLADFGHEVHIVTSDMQPNFNNYTAVYEKHLGPREVNRGTTQLSNFTLHRLRLGSFLRQPRLKNIRKILKDIAPDIIQTMGTVNFSTLEIALICKFSPYKLFTESHLHASVFPPYHQKLSILKKLKWGIYQKTVGIFLNHTIEKCYVISEDTKHIMASFFGISQKKLPIVPLASDPDLFKPNSQEREKQRQRLAYSTDDLVCIYTGRFSSDKNPLCLAKAIERLRQKNSNVHGLFVGAGSKQQVSEITNTPGCKVIDFVPAQELPAYYQLSDIGVWPKQESTSQLDAMACGLPLILSNKVLTPERHEGNGLLYEENNIDDLARCIDKFFDKTMYNDFSSKSKRKIVDELNWKNVARLRINDYETALPHD